MGKKRNTRRKKRNLKRLKGKRERKSVKSKRKWSGIERREAKTPVMIEVVIGEARGVLVAEGKKMKGLEVGHGEVVVVVVAGGIERRERRMSGVQEVAKIGEGMMMVLLEGVHRLEGVPHLEEALHQEEMAQLGGGEMLHQEDPHQDVEVEMMVHQEGVLLLEGILEKEMVVVPGDQAQGMILLVTGVVQEEGEILVTDEVLPGEWETGRLLEEDLQGGTLEEMMIGEEGLLHVALPLIVMGEECGAVVVIGLLLLLEEGLLQGVVRPLEEDHPLGVDLPLVEDLVMMDPLIGAATDLLPVTTLHLPNQDQPVNTKMKAGRLSSVRPPASWDSPGNCDIIVRLPGFITLVGIC